MRQAIHILKKDIRHLWIEIAVVLAANGLFTFIHTNPKFWQSGTQMPQTVAAFLVSFLLPVAWWVLIVRAIHGETLTGDREFWPTRPYSWKSLLAAKAMFIFLFVNLPILVAHASILLTHGFHLGSEFASLLWNQVLLTAALFLPVAAVGALTTGIVQFLLIGLVTFAVLILLSLRFTLFATTIAGGTWGPMEWIRLSYTLAVVALAALAILIWQYAYRRTTAARVAAGALVIAVGLGAPFSWTRAFSIQSRFSSQPTAGNTIHAGWNTGFQWMTRALVRDGHGADLNIPLQLTGVANNLAAKPEGISFSIETPGGTVWHSSGPRGNVTSTGQLIALRATLDESFYRAIKDQPVAIRGDLYLTLYGNRRETKVPVRGPVQNVPGMGLCRATSGWSPGGGGDGKLGGPPATYFLTCYAGIRPRAEKVAIVFEPHPRVVAEFDTRFPASYSPLPAELSIMPLSASSAYSTYQGPLDAVTVSSEEPVAFVRAPLLIEGLRLGAYETVMK
jgi:hypothetical protein